MRVLIVDDEPNICEGLAILSSRALGSGHVIAAESDPVRALERLAEESYDLLITDISMPEIDGLELTRRAKRRSLISHVVIVTGYEEFTYAREALRQGAVDFLLKPVDKEELAAALRSVSDALERNTDADPQSAPVTRALLPGQPAVAADAQTYSTRTGSPRVAVLVTTLAGGTRLRSLARVATREALGAHHRDSAVTVVPAERVDAVVALVPRPADTADEPARVRAWADVVNEYPLGVALGDLRRDALETLADRAYTALVGATLSGTPIVVWTADA
ncbi:MAG: response regulator, partial [Spirochaetota bacterium]